MRAQTLEELFMHFTGVRKRNLALFRHSLRGHVKLGIVFLAVMSLYGGMITAMFDP